MHLRKFVLSFFGFVFLGIGTIGIFLPVWPTTPFVILSAACFSTTPKIKKKIMKVNFFREHINNYENRNGLSLKVFAISFIWLWSMLLLSIVIVEYIYIRFLLAIVGILVSVHLIVMKKTKDKKS